MSVLSSDELKVNARMLAVLIRQWGEEEQFRCPSGDRYLYLDREKIAQLLLVPGMQITKNPWSIVYNGFYIDFSLNEELTKGKLDIYWLSIANEYLQTELFPNGGYTKATAY